MITLSTDDMDYVDEAFKGNFSKYISTCLNAHATGMKYASQCSSKQLLAIVMNRQQFDANTNHAEHEYSVNQSFENIYNVLYALLNDSQLL